MSKELFEHIKLPVQYWQDGQNIMDADGKMIADVRGWGWIQNHVKHEPELFQDKMGQFIADLINNSTSPAALPDVSEAVREMDWGQVEKDTRAWVAKEHAHLLSPTELKMTLSYLKQHFASLPNGDKWVRVGDGLPDIEAMVGNRIGYGEDVHEKQEWYREGLQDMFNELTNK